MRKYTILYITGICAVLLTLNGCKLGKHYVRPEMELPQTLNGQSDSLRSDTLSIADLP